MGERFPSNRNWLACPWVAALAGFPKPNRECSKTAKLDAIPTSHSIDNPIEDNVNDLPDVALVSVWVLSSDALDEFGFDHWSPRLSAMLVQL